MTLRDWEVGLYGGRITLASAREEWRGNPPRRPDGANDRHWAAFEGCVLQGRTLADVASELGVSSGRVQVLVHTTAVKIRRERDRQEAT